MSGSVITEEICKALAAKLRADFATSVLKACYQIEKPQVYNPLKQAIWRVRHDKASDAEIVKMFPIMEALDWQEAELKRLAFEAAADGRRTNWYEWLLERMNRRDYGRQSAVEVTGKDGSELGAMPVKDLLDAYMQARKDAGEGK